MHPTHTPDDPPADGPPSAPSLHVTGTDAGIEPHELTCRPPGPGSTRVVCIDYAPGRAQATDVADVAGFVKHHRADWVKVRWISVRGLSDTAVLRALAEKYGLHPLAIEDVLTPQRPKADDYPASGELPGRLFVVARGARRNAAGKLETEQISLFLGRTTLISFEDDNCDLFDGVRRRVEKPGSRIAQNDASFLLYALLDVLVDNLFPLLEDLGRRVDHVERVVLDKPTAHGFQRIRHLKRELVGLRRVVWPMRELVLELRRDQHECLSDTTQTYIRDVYDHVVIIVEVIENHRDLMSDLLDTYMSAVAQRTNEIMKVLTIISTIFVPLTFLAGVYGMNMPIPENEWRVSYPIFWAICLTAIGGMLYWFRRKGWL